MKESTITRCSHVCCNIPKSIKRVIHQVFYFSFNYSWVANKLPPPLVKFWNFFQFRNVYMFIWTAPPPCLFIIPNAFLLTYYAMLHYATSLAREWKVYYSLVYWHRWSWCQGPCPISRLGCGGFLERSLMCWVITGLGWVFHSGTSEINK